MLHESAFFFYITPMTRLQWLMQTCFLVLDSLRKQIFRDILGCFLAYFIMKMDVVYTHYNFLIEAILMSIHNIVIL